MIPRFSPQHSIRDIFASILPKKHALESFETDFAHLSHSRYAVAFPYGRTGLIAIIKALGIQEKEIICPAYTCVVVPHAIRSTNNQPVFVDSTTDDFNMDLSAIDALVNDKTAAIIATSIFGHPLSIDKIKHLQKKYPHIYIIQDGAHSFFCEDNRQFVHKQGIASFYGMNISKIIHGMFLGAVATDDEKLYIKLKNLQNNMLTPSTTKKSLLRIIYSFATWLAFKSITYGLVLKIKNLGWIDRFTKYYDEKKIDLPEDYLEQTSTFDLKIASRILKNYDQIILIRRACANLYSDQLKAISDLHLPPINEGATYSHYVVRTPRASELKEYLLTRGIEPGELIEYLIPKMAAYNDSREFSVSEKFVGSTLNLNVHQVSNAKKTIEVIQDFYMDAK